jgi:hypothetical protein
MITPQQKTMKNEKKTMKNEKNLDSIEFTVVQTKMTSFHLDYQAFMENYIQEYPEDLECSETTEEFENRCETIWKMVCSKTGKYDEIALDEADCDDDVDEDYVCDSSHDYIQDIVDEYNKTCPKWKAYDELQRKNREEEHRKREEKKKQDEEAKKQKTEEDIKKQQKIAELTAQLEKLRSS